MTESATSSPTGSAGPRVVSSRRPAWHRTLRTRVAIAAAAFVGTTGGAAVIAAQTPAATDGDGTTPSESVRGAVSDPTPAGIESPDPFARADSPIPAPSGFDGGLPSGSTRGS